MFQMYTKPAQSRKKNCKMQKKTAKGGGVNLKNKLPRTVCHPDEGGIWVVDFPGK